MILRKKLSPTLVDHWLPFKLMLFVLFVLFVLVDGWSLVMGSMAQSFVK